MEALYAVIAFVGGAILGSFATALAHRLPRGENWVSERSRCPNCGEMIGARDNIPIASWFILRGRCRNCGEPISSRYVLAELALALLFLAT
ncbi:MAG: prepilin peptidase, partial [Actinomycetota bacterium]|nr:prepilin peptidase [Actinomycetota bacterium]